MKRVLAIISLLLSFANAEINECVSDVYFANGINTNETEADNAVEKISEGIKTTYPKLYKSVANWKVALNHAKPEGKPKMSQSFLNEILELPTGSPNANEISFISLHKAESIKLKAFFWNLE